MNRKRKIIIMCALIILSGVFGTFSILASKENDYYIYWLPADTLSAAGLIVTSIILAKKRKEHPAIRKCAMLAIIIGFLVIAIYANATIYLSGEMHVGVRILSIILYLCLFCICMDHEK